MRHGSAAERGPAGGLDNMRRCRAVARASADDRQRAFPNACYVSMMDSSQDGPPMVVSPTGAERWGPICCVVTLCLRWPTHEIGGHSSIWCRPWPLRLGLGLRRPCFREAAPSAKVLTRDISGLKRQRRHSLACRSCWERTGANHLPVRREASRTLVPHCSCKSRICRRPHAGRPSEEWA